MTVLPPPKRPPDKQALAERQAQPRLQAPIPTAKTAVTAQKRLRVFICSTYGESGLAIAKRLLSEGHAPELYILQEDCRACGKGIVPLVEDFPGRFTDYDLLVSSDKNFARVVSECGIPAFGPNREAEKMEDSRQHGIELMEKHGIAVPPWKFFQKRQDAEKWIKAHRRCVFKPNGDHAPKMLTYAAKNEDSSDLLGVMEFAEKKYPEVMAEGFVIQQFVDGIEISAGSWFNGVDFLRPIALNFEHKSFGIKPYAGPPTGEMGSVSFYTEKSKLFDETTAKMAPYLKKIKYACDFDINCILTEKGPLALEFTPRCGFPAICLQLSNFDEDFGHLLLNVANGTAKTVKTKAPWVTGLVYTSPPFPYEDEVRNAKDYEGWPVDGPITTDSDIYPIGVEEKDGQIMTTGIGLVAVACGTGKTAKASKEATYKTLDQLYTPYCYARTDIGDRVIEAEPELKKRGYL